MELLTLNPVDALTGEVTLPGSKSISNRALLLAALANGDTVLENLLRSDDTAVMQTALTQLGVAIATEGSRCRVTGRGGVLTPTPVSANLHMGLAGTAIRPLAAALCAGLGQFELDGVPRMRERPIGDLVNALRPLGAQISYLGEPGFPPLRIDAHGLKGGTSRISGAISSQFLTALLMAAPLAEAPVRIDVTDTLVSKPYIDITLGMMTSFGVNVSRGTDYAWFEVAPTPYHSPGTYAVEGDASSASYFLAAGAVRGNGMTVHGIGADSVQGDVRFAEVLEQMGAQITMQANSITVRPGTLRGIDIDLNHIPDAAMTIAVLALLAEGRTTIRNIGNWRVKETDRLSAMATELRKLGAAVEEGEAHISVTPPASIKPAQIATYGDHRMAMCFSLAALTGVPVTIEDPTCVGKTFPDYFDVFRSLAA